MQAVRIGEILERKTAVTSTSHSDAILAHRIVAIVIILISKRVVRVVLSEVVNKLGYARRCNKLLFKGNKDLLSAAIAKMVKKSEMTAFLVLTDSLKLPLLQLGLLDESEA